MCIRTVLAAAVFAAGLSATTRSTVADTNVAILSGGNGNPGIMSDTASSFDEPLLTSFQSGSCG
ncbi:hypothetical protein ACFVFS_18760 [Kitasatospora sp. NPDC057692]|uniref:hypothetical protein n=1 Tax=Kitasatospora sp. NPDC057692 TaxID=3346215 RepID=UPI00367A6A8F